jgi:pyruvate dehydrogenase E2 component (dihydrolipoamide acetyltransferase)
MTRIIVPFIDANIVDVTVTDWRKQVGDTVTAGEMIAELTTDKAAFEVEAPGSGTLLEIYASPKSVVPVYYILALIGATGESDPQAAGENDALMQAYRAQVSTGSSRAPASAVLPAAAAAAPHADASRTRATPKARRLAQTHGLDLAAIQARTGVDIVTEAVLAPFLPGARS